jgi:hypothetical protein
MNMNKAEIVERMTGPVSRLLLVTQLMQNNSLPKVEELASAVGAGMSADLMSLCGLIDEIGGFTEEETISAQKKISAHYASMMKASKKLAARVEDARLDDIDLVVPNKLSEKAFDDLMALISGEQK